MNRRGLNLETLVAEKTISEKGKNWLYQALDPFHDRQIDAAGYPDTAVAGSVVSRVMRTMTFSKPSEVTSSNWDCNIAMFPAECIDSGPTLATEWHCTNTLNPSLLFPAASPTTFRFNPVGVVAFCTNAGQKTYLGNPNATANCDNFLTLEGSGQPYLTGNCRVVAKGFEVTDSTSQLNKQGMATCWRQPTPSPDNLVTMQFSNNSTMELPEDDLSYCSECKTCIDLWRGDKDCCSCGKSQRMRKTESFKSKEKPGPAAFPTSYGALSVYNQQAPPPDLQSAMLLAGTQTWEESKGMYIPAPMNSLANPPKQKAPIVAALWETSLTGNTNNGVTLTTTVGTASVNSPVYVPNTLQHIDPFDMVGCYLTGLNPQSTITVTAIWWVEKFPTPFEGNLVVLTKPSPGFDPVALEIYGRALEHLPVGVPVGANPLGEWFKGVLDVVRDYAIPAGKAIGMVVPGVGAVANAAEAVTNVLRPAVKKAKKRERNRAQKQIGSMGQSVPPRQGKQ